MQWEALVGIGFALGVIQTIIGCSQDSSNRPYDSYITRWQTHCERMGFDPLSPTVPQVLNFLQSLCEEPSAHRGYSAICTARSALISFLDKSIIDNNFMNQFIRGVYNQDPPRVRYDRIWDPKTVLDMLKQPPWTPTSQLNFLDLTKKTVFLISITSGQRGQIIPALSLKTWKNLRMVTFSN